jgi:hypothetical protein
MDNNGFSNLALVAHQPFRSTRQFVRCLMALHIGAMLSLTFACAVCVLPVNRPGSKPRLRSLTENAQSQVFIMLNANSASELQKINSRWNSAESQADATVIDMPENSTDSESKRESVQEGPPAARLSEQQDKPKRHGVKFTFDENDQGQQASDSTQPKQEGQAASMPNAPVPSTPAPMVRQVSAEALKTDGRAIRATGSKLGAKPSLGRKMSFWMRKKPSNNDLFDEAQVPVTPLRKPLDTLESFAIMQHIMRYAFGRVSLHIRVPKHYSLVIIIHTLFHTSDVAF